MGTVEPGLHCVPVTTTGVLSVSLSTSSEGILTLGYLRLPSVWPEIFPRRVEFIVYVKRKTLGSGNKGQIVMECSTRLGLAATFY